MECCGCSSTSPIRFDDILINTGDFSVSYRDFVVVAFGTLKCVIPAECIFIYFFYFFVYGKVKALGAIL